MLVQGGVEWCFLGRCQRRVQDIYGKHMTFAMSAEFKSNRGGEYLYLLPTAAEKGLAPPAPPPKGLAKPVVVAVPPKGDSVLLEEAS